MHYQVRSIFLLRTRKLNYSMLPSRVLRLLGEHILTRVQKENMGLITWASGLAMLVHLHLSHSKDISNPWVLPTSLLQHRGPTNWYFNHRFGSGGTSPSSLLEFLSAHLYGRICMERVLLIMLQLLLGTEGGVSDSASLGSSATGLPGHDFYDNTTIESCINKQGRTPSYSLPNNSGPINVVTFTGHFRGQVHTGLPL